MLTKCDPEKHTDIIKQWYEAADPQTTNTQKDGTNTGKGYSLAEYAKLLTGGK